MWCIRSTRNLADARARIAAAFLAIICVTSCSGNARVSPGYACPVIDIVGPFLLYPIPGATNVPRAAGELVLAYVPTTGSGRNTRPITTELVENGTAIVFTDTYQAAPSTLPNPHATAPANYPTGVGPPVAVPYPALHPSTTYHVTYDDGTTSPCPTHYGYQSFTTGP